MIGILNELCMIPTAFGMEKGILSYIEKEYAKNLEYSYDGMGNLTVLKKCGRDNAKKVMLYASCDACGFIVNYICDDGMLRVTGIGVNSAISASYTCLVSEKGVQGFIVPEKGAEIKDGDIAKMYVDIGARSRAEAEKAVKLGDVFAYAPSVFTQLCEGKLGGGAVASKAPIAILLKLLGDEESLDCDVYFCFGVQNASRNRGAKTAAFDISPDLCVSVGLCESFDVIGANKRGEAVLGDGAVILAKTGDYCMPPEIRKNITAAAERENISHKVCIYPDKTCCASQISSCGKGTECVEICLPARNIGSGAEIFDISDAENITKLISLIIAE